MKFGKILKRVIIPSCLCATALFVGGEISGGFNFINDNKIVVMASNTERKEITIQSTTLKSKLYELLDKKASDKLYSDDFMVSNHYKVVTELNPETGLDETKAERNCLDLSSSGITDITELVQFEFPSTLNAIDLSGNGITEGDLEQLIKVCNISYGTTPTIQYTTSFSTTTLDVRCNFFVSLSKVNLSINKINLDKITPSDAKYDMFIFGVQNLPDFGTSTLIPTTQSGNAKYFFRSTDTSYLTLNKTITNANGKVETIQTLYGVVNDLIDNTKLGKYQIKIQNPPKTESGYFHGLDKVLTFDLFSISIDPSFTIERRDMFVLPTDKVIVDGLGLLDTDYTIITNTNTPPSTKDVGIAETIVTVATSDGRSRKIVLGVNIVDTTAPIITLEGGFVSYLSRGNDFIEPGFKAIDNGEDISSLVIVDKSNLKVYQNGVYVITYNVTDSYGNKATEVKRTIKVEEHVLDRIVITCNTENPKKGQDVELKVSPNSNIEISEYKDFEYKFYIDNILFQTVKGDNATGKAFIKLNLNDVDIATIKVVLNVTRVADSSKLQVVSQPFTLELGTVTNPMDNNMVTTAGIVAGVVIVIIIFTIIIKKSKKGKTHSKKKKEKSNKAKVDNNVQIVKNYEGIGNSSAFESAMNSQPQEFRPEDSYTPPVSNNQTAEFQMFEEPSEVNQPDTSNQLGRIEVAQVPADQAINGGTQPNAGQQDTSTNNNNNDNNDVWF